MNFINPVNVAKYAQRNGFRTASVKINDGSELKILNNMKNDCQIFRFKNDKLVEAQGFKNTNQNAYWNTILDVVNKIRKNASDTKDLYADIMKQWIS